MSENGQSIMDSILNEERIHFKKQVSKLNPETPYYVYALCLPNGQPFYIGKGCGMRAWDHLVEATRKHPHNNLKLQVIHDLLDINEYPIMHICESNLTEIEAYDIEEQYIKFYGRYDIDELGVLTNRMPKHTTKNPSSEISRLAGLKGGKTTRDLGVGIFSEDWDRSKQTKLNWESGCYDNVDFESRGRRWGNNTKENNKGIFDPKYEHLRSEWARNAAMKCKESGNMSGIYNKEWREENKDLVRSVCAKGGRVGGKIVGSMLWWTDGENNKKSNTCPGEGWYRGMTKRKNKNV